MTITTSSAGASSVPTKSFEKVVGGTGEATSRTHCQIFTFEAYSASALEVPNKHSSIGQLVDIFNQDDVGRAALEEGRQWIADNFYGEDGDTVRSLRLRKGWSQARLAEELATSQPHIARIERGTENLAIGTCRKLSKALGIDLNTLDQALERQEIIARAKQK